MSRVLFTTGLLLASGCGSDGNSPASAGSETTAIETSNEAGSTTPSSPLTRDVSTNAAEGMTGPVSHTSETAEPTATQTIPSTPQEPEPSSTSEPPGSGEGQAPTTVSAGDPVLGEQDAGTSSSVQNTAMPNTQSGETSEALSFAAHIWPLWVTDRDPLFVYRGMGSYTGCADDTAPCHGAQTPGAQLTMSDADTTYAQLVDTPSVSGLCAGSQRVVVGDPENSCLIQFYVGRLGKEDLDWVTDSEIELMREWIRQGALP